MAQYRRTSFMNVPLSQYLKIMKLWKNSPQKLLIIGPKSFSVLSLLPKRYYVIAQKRARVSCRFLNPIHVSRERRDFPCYNITPHCWGLLWFFFCNFYPQFIGPIYLLNKFIGLRLFLKCKDGPFLRPLRSKDHKCTICFTIMGSSDVLKLNWVS